MTATHLAFIGFAVILAIILAFSFIVLWKILVGDIHLEGLIAETEPADGDAHGKASLSRFQFLIFTFVIAGLFLLLSIEHGTFVEVPGDVLGLMGISGASYVGSKLISDQTKVAIEEKRLKGREHDAEGEPEPNDGQPTRKRRQARLT